MVGQQETHDGKVVSISGDADGDRRLAYARIKASLLVTYQSLIDSPKTDLGVLKDAIVVIGATAPSLQDIHPTSTDSAMPGPEIQANAIETVLKGRPLTSFPGWVTIVAARHNDRRVRIGDNDLALSLTARL